MLFAAGATTQGEQVLYHTAKSWPKGPLILLLVLIALFIWWFLKKRR